MAENLNQCIWEAYEWYEAKTEWYEKFQEGMNAELQQALIAALNSDNIHWLTSEEIAQEVQMSYMDFVQRPGWLTSDGMQEYLETLWYNPDSPAISWVINAIDTYNRSVYGYINEWTDTHNDAVKWISDCSKEATASLIYNPEAIIGSYGRPRWWSENLIKRVASGLSDYHTRLLEASDEDFAVFENSENATDNTPNKIIKWLTEEEHIFVQWLWYRVFEDVKSERVR